MSTLRLWNQACGTAFRACFLRRLGWTTSLRTPPGEASTPSRSWIARCQDSARVALRACSTRPSAWRKTAVTRRWPARRLCSVVQLAVSSPATAVVGSPCPPPPPQPPAGAGTPRRSGSAAPDAGPARGRPAPACTRSPAGAPPSPRAGHAQVAQPQAPAPRPAVRVQDHRLHRRELAGPHPPLLDLRLQRQPGADRHAEGEPRLHVRSCRMAAKLRSDLAHSRQELLCGGSEQD